jgi:hypothetical protein
VIAAVKQTTHGAQRVCGCPRRSTSGGTEFALDATAGRDLCFASARTSAGWLSNESSNLAPPSSWGKDPFWGKNGPPQPAGSPMKRPVQYTELGVSDPSASAGVEGGSSSQVTPGGGRPASLLSNAASLRTSSMLLDMERGDGSSVSMIESPRAARRRLQAASRAEVCAVAAWIRGAHVSYCLARTWPGL